MLRKIADAMRRSAGRGTRGRIRWDRKNRALHAEIDFLIQIEEDTLDGGYVVSCVNLPGCMSQGETVEEAFDNIGEAIGGVLACRFEREVGRQGALTAGASPKRQLTIPVRVDSPADYRPHATA